MYRAGDHLRPFGQSGCQCLYLLVLLSIPEQQPSQCSSPSGFQTPWKAGGNAPSERSNHSNLLASLNAAQCRNLALFIFAKNHRPEDCHPFFAKDGKSAISIIGADFVGKNKQPQTRS